MWVCQGGVGYRYRCLWVPVGVMALLEICIHKQLLFVALWGGCLGVHCIHVLGYVYTLGRCLFIRRLAGTNLHMFYLH
jgi:hypothetical protein